MKRTEEMIRLDKDLKADPELRKKFREAMLEANKSGTYQNDRELIIEAAKTLGYEISVGELERSIAEKEEVDPQEMEQVAGGESGESHCDFFWKQDLEDEYGHGNWCVTLWHCEVVTMHTSSDSKREWCMANYRCSDLYYCWDHYMKAKK